MFFSLKNFMKYKSFIKYTKKIEKTTYFFIEKNKKFKMKT